MEALNLGTPDADDTLIKSFLTMVGLHQPSFPTTFLMYCTDLVHDRSVTRLLSAIIEPST